MSLFKASETGDFVEMRRLLDSGAQPDIFPVSGRHFDGDDYLGTALVAAAAAGHLDAVRLLLDRGADPSLADGRANTPLMHATMSGHEVVVRELAARGADLDAAHPASGATAFHLACGANQAASARRRW